MSGIRQAAEALYKRLHVDSADFDVPQIEAFAKAQRAEECEALTREFDEHLNENIFLDCRKVVKDLKTWLDARAKEWRG